MNTNRSVLLSSALRSEFNKGVFYSQRSELQLANFGRPLEDINSPSLSEGRKLKRRALNFTKSLTRRKSFLPGQTADAEGDHMSARDMIEQC